MECQQGSTERCSCLRKQHVLKCYGNVTKCYQMLLEYYDNITLLLDAYMCLFTSDPCTCAHLEKSHYFCSGS